MDTFIGRQNTVSTRGQVVSMITYYFQSQIMNKECPPNAFSIICDESEGSNTKEVIQANQLKVTVQIELYGSIKQIYVHHEVYPIYLWDNVARAA